MQTRTKIKGKLIQRNRCDSQTTIGFKHESSGRLRGPAWYGFTNSAEKDRLQALLNKATRWGLNVKAAPELQGIIKSADKKLFGKILCCASHVLHSFLPPVKPTSQRLRRRAHDRILPIKTTSTERNFFIRMLYS